MKKLLMLAAATCAVAITQAATVSWSVTGLKDSTGSTLTTGAGYIFCTKGNNATTVDAVTAALAALTSADALKTYLSDNSLTALTGTVASGEVSVSGVDISTSGVPAGTSAVKIFAVIVDDAAFGDDVKYVVTATSGNVKTPAASTTNTATFNLDGASATASASNWTAVPEPTSGLLLVLGMAGLALKRKRA